MKSKELIAEILKRDPSGELEVIAGGTPIYFVDCEPAYYDGPLKILVQDKSRSGYNIVGFKYTHQGNKIRLHLMDLDDVLLNDPDLPIDISEVSEHSSERTLEFINKTREEMRSIIKKVKDKTNG